MKHILLAGVLMAPAYAYAWSTDPVPPPPVPTATATATGGAATATAAGGAATATQRQHQGQRQSQSVTVNNAAPASSGVDPATAARLAAAGSGHNWQQPVASAVAPSFGIAGPCTGAAASVAGQFELFGLSFGGTDMDKGCQAEHLGNLSTVGERIGFEVMCDDRQFRAAAQRAGATCAADRPQQQVAAPAAPATKTIPDWCLTASPAERRRHSKECSA